MFGTSRARRGGETAWCVDPGAWRRRNLEEKTPRREIRLSEDSIGRRSECFPPDVGDQNDQRAASASVRSSASPVFRSVLSRLSTGESLTGRGRAGDPGSKRWRPPFTIALDVAQADLVGL